MTKENPMHKRLSRHTLFQLRNDIPIDFVIQNVLHIPFKMSEGYLRFLCPLCHEFNSAINHNANLATCFRCNKHFNPIDLLIAEKGISFNEAVSLLTLLLQNHPPDDISYQNLRDIHIDAVLQAFEAFFLTDSQTHKNAIP